MTAIRRLLLVASLAALILGFGMLAVVLIEGHSLHPASAANGAAGAALGGPFTLIRGDGKTVTDQAFRGKWLLVYFGYTYCPDVCPTTLNNIAQALAHLGAGADAVTPVFITVDPKRDTPQVIGNYVKSFDPRIIGLTGNDAEIAAVAKEYRVYYKPAPPQGGDYLVDHSSFVYLMDRSGKFAKVLPGSDSGVDMADAIRPLIAAAPGDAAHALSRPAAAPPQSESARVARHDPRDDDGAGLLFRDALPPVLRCDRL